MTHSVAAVRAPLSPLCHTCVCLEVCRRARAVTGIWREMARKAKLHDTRGKPAWRLEPDGSLALWSRRLIRMDEMDDSRAVVKRNLVCDAYHPDEEVGSTCRLSQDRKRGN